MLEIVPVALVRPQYCAAAVWSSVRTVLPADPTAFDLVEVGGVGARLESVGRATAQQVGVSENERADVLQPGEGVVDAADRPPLAWQRADREAERPEAAVAGACR